MTSLAFNLLVAMTERKELISGGGVLRPAKIKHGKTKDALWSPILIGANYRLNRERNNSGANAADMENSVRLHWRRGHWRRHAHGPSLALRKRIWLETVLVGGTNSVMPIWCGSFLLLFHVFASIHYLKTTDIALVTTW
jgi:hypothetical protein